jgi:hypothetical protein
VSAWLDRFRTLVSDRCVGAEISEISEKGGFGDNGDFSTGISPEIEGAGTWFDRQIRLLNQDLAAEGTTLNRVLASMRPKRRKRSQEEVREARRRREYLADFAVRPGAPLTPCACGDVVFFQLVGDCRWRCRSCERVTARARMRWFVLDPKLVGIVRRIEEVYPGVVVAEVRPQRRVE